MTLSNEDYRTLCQGYIDGDERVPHDLMMAALKSRADDLSPDFGEGWMSNAARDMTRIAICLAGFDQQQLIVEIIRRKGDRKGRVNQTTVLNSMDALHLDSIADTPQGLTP